MFRQNDRYGASAKPSPGLLAGRLHVGLCAAQLADQVVDAIAHIVEAG